MAENNTAPTGASVDAFIAATEPAGRREDAVALKAIIDRVTAADAVMWGPTMVGYGSYAYRYASGHSGELFVVGFSPRKASMSLYGLQIPENADLLARLGRHRAGAGCIWVGRFGTLDLAVLEQLVANAWAARDRL